LRPELSNGLGTNHTTPHTRPNFGFHELIARRVILNRTGPLYVRYTIESIIISEIENYYNLGNPDVKLSPQINTDF